MNSDQPKTKELVVNCWMRIHAHEFGLQQVTPITIISMILAYISQIYREYFIASKWRDNVNDAIPIKQKYTIPYLPCNLNEESGLYVGAAAISTAEQFFLHDYGAWHKHTVKI